MTKKTFVIDKIKSLILTVGLMGGIIYFLTFLYYKTNPLTFYLYALGGASLFILITYLLYAKVFVRIFNKLIPLEDGELKTESFKGRKDFNNRAMELQADSIKYWLDLNN